MRIFLASILSIVALSCSSAPKDDAPKEREPVVDASVTPDPVEAAVTPDPVEVDPGPDLSTPYKAVYHALLSAQMANEEDAFQAYLAVVHPDAVATDEAKETLRQEQWLRFRKQHDRYIRSGSRADYIMTKMVPAKLTEETDEVRIFVRDLVHKDNPAIEIVVKRHGKQWRIVSNSM